jgi:ParB-like chromosome segregation protein Spo0J
MPESFGYANDMPADGRRTPAWVEPRLPDDDRVPVVSIPVNALTVADSPRVLTENAEHVHTLVQTEEQFPPIIVHRPTMAVIDGVHRLGAAKLRNESEIPVRFFSGTEQDAFVIAVRANIGHGLPLSLAEREAAAARIVASHPQWSDRMIATTTGLAARTVAKVRRRHPGLSDSTQPRIGRDGRVRPIDSSAARTRAAELLSEDPAMSLRDVARLTGISRETVRNVRRRLRNDEGPLPFSARGRRPSLPDRQDGRGPRRPLRTPGEDTTLIVKRLCADPGLKYTENGRALLRLLQVHLRTDREWRKIGREVPLHCRALIARLARAYERRWADFAEELETAALKEGSSEKEAASN